ncbi:hypothetical protein CRYUN_Cryun23aG0086600 [Craigia yunnanensis]
MLLPKMGPTKLLHQLSQVLNVANSHYDVASNDSKSSPSQQGDRIGASGEVSAPLNVNLHTCEVDHPHASPCDSESFCNSNSSSGVALHCASVGG